MNIREWALISFTILAQMSVGAFLLLGMVHTLVERRAGAAEADRMSDRALLAIGPTLVLGMGASLLHLGTPWIAYGAIANVGSSWLSREILCGVLFAGIGAVFALVQWRKMGTASMRSLLGWVAALVGVALVYSMSQVYLLPAEPSWNSWATPVSFLTTTLLLGSLAMGAALVANYGYVKGKDPSCEGVQCGLLRTSLKWIALLSMVLLGVEFVAIPLSVAQLSMGPAAAVGSIGMLIGQYGVVFGVRLGLVFLGAGVFGALLYRSAQDATRESLMGNLVYGAFALVLASELLGRFLFYATQVRLGI